MTADVGVEQDVHPGTPRSSPPDSTYEPRLSGVMIDSGEYTNMGVGLTDNIMILGHADGMRFNTPWRVTSLKETIKEMGGDLNSPLLRATFEAYYAGARDISIMAVAPMSEYVEDTDSRNDELDGGRTFYQIYQDRLDEAYDILSTYDEYRIMVPVSATFHGADGCDFLGQVTAASRDNFNKTGDIRMSIIGMDTVPMGEEVDSLIGDLSDFINVDETASDGKFIVPVVGQCSVNIREIERQYVTSPVAGVAGLLSSSSYQTGLTYKPIPNVLTTIGPDMKKADIQKLSRAKINPLIRTTRAKRGMGAEVVLATDNTLGRDGTDYWAVPQVRLVSMVNHELREIGRREVGRNEFYRLKGDMDTFMKSLVRLDILRDYDLKVTRTGPTKDYAWADGAIVEVALHPYFGIREVSFITEVGPI